MNFLKYIILFLLIMPNNLQAKPQVYFDYKVYYTPDHLPYVETLMQFSSASLKYLANEKGYLVSSVEITQIFKLGDSIVMVDKYIVNSPQMMDSTIEDYYDVKRFQLSEGIYSYEIIVADLNNQEIISGKQTIDIKKYEENNIGFSSLGFIQSASKSTEKSSFVKNGFFILPYLTNYFPPVNDKIATYFELYNTASLLGENEKFMLTFEIENFESGKKHEEAFKFQKFTTAKVVPVISFLSIENLPSGEYNLVVSLIDKNNVTIKTEKLFFQRRSDLVVSNEISIENLDIANSFTNGIDYDSIPFFLNSLLPISPRYEYESILALLESGDTLVMQKYFHSFWVQTDAKSPYESWVKYKAQMLYVEKMFGTQIKHGFETDRGRIYLKYGTPNDIMDRPNEPSAYPYQIWHYYRIGQRSNIRFVFYNPDLVTNDYPMLHSELPGEIQNYRWQHDLHKRDSPNTNLDDANDGNKNHYGGNSSIYFNN